MLKETELRTPHYIITSLVASNNPDCSLALIDLGNYSIIKLISKNAVIGTANIGGSSEYLKSIDEYDIGASQIYGIISGSGYTSQISISINSELVSDPITIKEDDCCKIYSLYYGQNFGSLELPSDFCDSWNITTNIENDTNLGKYFVGYSTISRGEDLNLK